MSTQRLENLPTDEAQFRQNLESMGFQLPPGDLTDPKYVERLLTDFKDQLNASGIDPEAFEALVKSYQEELIAESDKPVLRSSQQSSGSEPRENCIALGTAAYLVAIQLALYESLTENMKFFNEMSAQNAVFSNKLAVVTAEASRKSIELDSDKERAAGWSKVVSGTVGLGITAGMKGYRATGRSQASKDLVAHSERSTNIDKHIASLNAKPVTKPAGVTTMVGATQSGDHTAHHTAIKKRMDDGTLGNKHDNAGLTDAEIQSLHGSDANGLRGDVINKLHAERLKANTAAQNANSTLDHAEQQSSQYTHLVSTGADATTNILSSDISNKKKEEEYKKSLGEANKQGIQQIARDAAEQSSNAARQQEAALAAMEKFDANSKR